MGVKDGFFETKNAFNSKKSEIGVEKRLIDVEKKEQKTNFALDLRVVTLTQLLNSSAK